MLGKKEKREGEGGEKIIRKCFWVCREAGGRERERGVRGRS